ncbi:MAG: ABC-2 family transporter protein [Candidatus Gracilibacteria bacterium]
MKKILRYLSRTLHMSFLLNAAYRMDFIWFVIMMPVFLASELLGIYFLFAAGNLERIAGFTFVEFVFVSSLAALTWMFTSLSAIGAGLIVRQINSGHIDMFLLKPLPFSIAVIGQKFYIKRFLQIFVRIIILICVLYFGKLTLSILQVFQILYVLATSLILYYALFIAAESLSFRFANLDMGNVLYDTIDQTTYYPAAVYPAMMRFIFTYILPIFLLVNPVYLILKNEYSFTHVITAFVITFLWILIAWYFWTEGKNAYESAN